MDSVRKGRARRLGRALLSVTSVFTMVGPYAADWNKTHVYNPNWPPHAKFHNGQTMSMGLALGACALRALWGGHPSRTRLNAAGYALERQSARP